MGQEIRTSFLDEEYAESLWRARHTEWVPHYNSKGQQIGHIGKQPPPRTKCPVWWSDYAKELAVEIFPMHFKK